MCTLYCTPGPSNISHVIAKFDRIKSNGDNLFMVISRLIGLHGVTMWATGFTRKGTVYNKNQEQKKPLSKAHQPCRRAQWFPELSVGASTEYPDIHRRFHLGVQLRALGWRDGRRCGRSPPYSAMHSRSAHSRECVMERVNSCHTILG